MAFGVTLEGGGYPPSGVVVIAPQSLPAIFLAWASPLPCRMRTLPLPPAFAAARLAALGHPTILEFSWHCSVQVSKVKEPLAGVMAFRKRSQARKAKLGPYWFSGSAEVGCALM